MVQKTIWNDCIILTGDARTITGSDFPDWYGVIVADPPWDYYKSTGQGTAEHVYKTMPITQLCLMPISDIALPDSVLMLWGTWPQLPGAIKLMSAWGFVYVTGFPWIKTTANGTPTYGVGYWVRGCSEYVLIGKRGKVSPPEQPGYLGLIGPALGHSRKPDDIHQFAESLPGPYLELFARRPRPGWTVFGNEIEIPEENCNV